ncbi:MAG: hypothetical protein WC514_03350 [Candidatus Paceibacterota bacterium]
MIELSNGHKLEFIVPSGALAFDGRGWPWEWPWRWLGLIDPKLFTIVIKTLTLFPRKGNLRRQAPLQVLKFISEKGETINPVLALLNSRLIRGVVNAVKLNNPGFDYWLEHIYPVIVKLGYKVIVSIAGTKEECVKMVMMSHGLKNVVAIEYNASCPNIGPICTESIAETSFAIKDVSDKPSLIKLGYDQPYLEIAKRVEDAVEAISINTVRWETIFPNMPSPLAKYGGGGVSGPVSQKYNWEMMHILATKTKIPVIGPGIWEKEDILRVKRLGASAYQFGTIFLPYPWRPTAYVKNLLLEDKKYRATKCP